jgi:FkbM family methyltransferase
LSYPAKPVKGLRRSGTLQKEEGTQRSRPKPSATTATVQSLLIHGRTKMLQRLWRKLAVSRHEAAAVDAPAAPAPTDLPPADLPPAAPPAPSALTRDAYIRSPLPIAGELRALFDPAEPLVIFDIGACEGEDSIRYAREFPNARIYAFEPVPSNLATLQRQLAAYGARQVQAFPLALSDARGTATFHVSSGSPEGLPNSEHWEYGNKSSSLLPPAELGVHYPWLKFDQAIEVQTETLAHFCAAHAIERIDFIHMDVQGAELKVLQGAGELLQSVRAIWLEAESVPLYAGQPLAGEIQAFMEANGFIKRMDTVGAVSGDHLYVHRDAG